MIAGLVIGKHMSMGCPGKNVRPVLGRPMVEYALMALANSKRIDKLFTSTDSPHIAQIGMTYGAEHIARPESLATPDALTEDALVHAFEEMEKRAGRTIEIIALAFANSPTIPPGMIDKAIGELEKNPELDSAFTVCKYNMWSPLRARKVDADGQIQPYVPPEKLGATEQMSSIRGGEGDCYFVDLAVQVLRRRCFTDMDNGRLPFKWMGHKSLALENDFGFDIDYEWQIPVIEYWLQTHGFTEHTTPFDTKSGANA